jgi:secretion/DNA translocation related TadE-like protein
MTPGRADRGSASVWLVVAGALLVAVALVASSRTLGVLARHRAEAAADLAAVAAAAEIGVGPDPCGAATRIAQANHARLLSCRPALAADGRSGQVEVHVRAEIDLPLVGSRAVLAHARAARLPEPTAG